MNVNTFELMSRQELVQAYKEIIQIQPPRKSTKRVFTRKYILAYSSTINRKKC